MAELHTNKHMQHTETLEGTACFCGQPLLISIQVRLCGEKNVSCLGSTVSARGDMKYAALCSPFKKKHQIEANQYSHCLFYL